MKAGNYTWVTEPPRVAPEATVDAFYLEMPLIGGNRVSDIVGTYHAAIGFIVRDPRDPTAIPTVYEWEYWAASFSGVNLPAGQTDPTNPSSPLFWQTKTIVSWVESKAEVFHKVWTNQVPLGTTTGKTVNDFAVWSKEFWHQFPRYQPYSLWKGKELLMHSVMCSDFTFAGVRKLMQLDAPAFGHITELPRSTADVQVEDVVETPQTPDTVKVFEDGNFHMGHFLENLFGDYAGPVRMVLRSKFGGEWFCAKWYKAPEGDNLPLGTLAQDTDTPDVYYKIRKVTSPWPPLKHGLVPITY